MKVYLVAKSALDYDAVAKFLNDTEREKHTAMSWVPWNIAELSHIYWKRLDSKNPSQQEGLIELAGRLCYMSFWNQRPGGIKAYLDNIKASGHGSVIEHATFSFIFTGVSRSLTHELVRHRAGTAFSQLSQRYVDESQVEIIAPPALQHCSGATIDAWKDQCVSMRRVYEMIVEDLMRHYADVEDKTLRRKIARQTARSILPNATETKIMMSANARAWRHFLEMRCSEHADTEIRKLAYEVYCKLVEASPILFDDYNVVSLDDGTHALETKYRKV